MFQLKYSSIIDDLQKDTDEEELSEKEGNVELPVQVDTHFKKFNIKYRKAESKEEVKQAISTLEKEALLLNLIPIAFNDEMESELLISSLFLETHHSINIIWDYILISFRFFGEPEGIHKCYFAEFKRLDKFFVENSTLPLADGELIVDIFKYCININDNLLGHRGIEISNIDSTTSRIDTDIVMQESLLPGVSETLGNSSLVDLILTRIEIQMDTWRPNATKLTENEYTEFSPYLSCTMSNWECCFCSTSNAACRS